MLIFPQVIVFLAIKDKVQHRIQFRDLRFLLIQERFFLNLVHQCYIFILNNIVVFSNVSDNLFILDPFLLFGILDKNPFNVVIIVPQK